MHNANQSGRPVRFLFFLACVLPIVPLVASLPPPPIAFRVLNDFAHAPVFGAFTVVIFELLRRRTTWPAWADTLSALVLAVVAGGIVELIQPLLGRTGEFPDLATDAFGAAAGLAIAALLSPRRHWIHAIVLLVAASAVLKPVVGMSLAYGERHRQFPALLEMSSRFDRFFLSSDGIRIATVLLPEKWRREGDPLSLELRMRGRELPSLTHAEPAQDWRGYTRLMVDLTNPDARPLALTLRVHDRAHDNETSDRFNHRFVLAGETRTVLAIPLDRVRQAPTSRELDLSRIAGVMLFGRKEQTFRGRVFYLTRVWLE
ncbi:MAG: hypothetical protein ACREVI_02295 [Steroidobacteraceae bacterium]